MNPQTYAFRAHWIVLVLLWVSIPIQANAQKKQAPWKPSAAPQEQYVAPLIYDPILYPLPCVRLRINGGKPFLFLIDTGCSFPMLIDSGAAEEMKLTANGHTFDIHHGAKAGDMASLQRVGIDCISTNTNLPVNFRLKVDSAAIIKNMLPKGFPSPSPIAGVIGMPILSAQTVTFDFVAKKLILSRSERLPVKIKDATVVALKPLDERFTVLVKTPDNYTVDFLLDTGSEINGLTEQDVSHFEITKTPTIVSGTWSVTGLHSVHVRLTRDFILGGRHEANIIVHSSNDDDQQPKLGMGVFSRFRVTIDARHQRLLLEPNTEYSARCRLPGLPSVMAARTRDKYIVREVLSGSSAAQAGILAGDTIVSVDGHSITLLPEETVQMLLDGIVDTEAELVLARKDNPKLLISYKRQSLFAMASGRDIGVGIGIAVTEAGKMIVTALQQSSPATEAGVRVDDEIVSINDLPVSTTPMQQLAAEMKRPDGAVIILKLLRHSDHKPYEVKLTVRRLPE